MRLGKLGLWTSALDRQPASVVRDAVAEIESLGFGAIWVGEASRREAIANASLLLCASTRIVIATGIANIWARDATAMAAAQKTLAEAWGGRFLLGLGVSHDALVGPRGHNYRSPLSHMSDYLDAMDRSPYDAPEPERAAMPRVLAALGPKMLDLARERADGAHPYLVPVEHTAMARERLGPSKLLCPEMAVVFDGDEDRRRDTALAHLSRYLTLPNYRRNLTRLGFGEADLVSPPSERLLDALVARSPEAASARIAEHFAAGADHLAVQVLSPDPARVPMREWRLLAQMAP